MALAGMDRVSNMAHSVGQRRITDSFSQPTDEKFD